MHAQCNFCAVLQSAVEDCVAPSLDHDPSRILIKYSRRELLVGLQRENPVRVEFTTLYLYTSLRGKDCPLFPINARRTTENARETTFSEPILTWLRQCDAEHQCWGTKAMLPSRVLDVGVVEGSDGRVYLYKSQGELVPYACLSYC
ncbi:hypothetical protein CC86DRAFT_322906 [Ophiobolus disseminans]|uniref:Uncharacterized protein n=1 Tax=Ophiobolus disseminans TaxID=1469910 RepID=A0A6A7A2L5_9PLEO|nr:hypothetical protein CC86DRAFT_322906 [Ophiobolus disseminans]